MAYIYNLIIVSLFLGLGAFIRNKTMSYKVFIFYDVLLFVVFFAFVLNACKLSDDNILLNFTSLIYFVACISIPPTIYMYIKSLSFDFSGGEKINNKFIHYVPSLILLLINLFSFIYFNISDENHIASAYVENIMTYSNVFAIYFIFFIQLFFYAFLTIKAYAHYQKNLYDIYTFENGIDFKWTKLFIAGFALVIFFVYAAQSIGDFAKEVLGYVVTAYVIVVNYSALKQEQMHGKIIKYIKGDKGKASHNSYTIEAASVSKEKFDTETVTETASGIDENMLASLSQNITQSMEKDKLYTDPELSLVKLAIILGTNTKYLSYCINTVFGKNFSTYINEYRISEAIQIMETDSLNQYTLEAIAEFSGFRSRSVFISAFKKTTGKTPSQFKKET